MRERGTAAELSGDPVNNGATYRRLWQLAWPVSVSASTMTLLTLANLFWIGHLGTAAVAAVSLCGNLLFILFGVANVVHTGVVAVVARRVGEGDHRRAFSGTVHGLLLGVILGSVAAIGGYLAAPFVVRFFGAEAQVEAIAVTYLRIMSLGQLPLFITTALAAAYQAAGDTRTPMLVNVALVLLNAVADPFFIFAPGELVVAGFDLGWLGLGAAGGAIAASSSGVAGCLLLFAISLASGKPIRPSGDQAIILSLRELGHMARIGAPAAVSMAARPLSTFLLLKIIAGFGTAAIAAFGIALRAFSLNWIPYSGIHVAVASLVGQSLGARRVATAELVVWRALIITGGLGLLYCLIYWQGAEGFLRTFDSEPDVLAAGVPFLQLMALSFLFTGPTIPLFSAMNGAGDTRPPMIVAFLANWPVKLPLSYLLAIPAGWGVNGVWVGMFVSLVFEAVLAVWWYRRGTWKTRKL